MSEIQIQADIEALTIQITASGQKIEMKEKLIADATGERVKQRLSTEVNYLRLERRAFVNERSNLRLILSRQQSISARQSRLDKSHSESQSGSYFGTLFCFSSLGPSFSRSSHGSGLSKMQILSTPSSKTHSN
jgi:hypothetical protein